jgi:hypothetical protein
MVTDCSPGDDEPDARQYLVDGAGLHPGGAEIRGDPEIKRTGPAL